MWYENRRGYIINTLYFTIYDENKKHFLLLIIKLNEILKTKI